MNLRRLAIVAPRFPLDPPTPPGEDCYAAPAGMMAEAGCEVEILTLRHAAQPACEQSGGITVRRFPSRDRLLTAIACGRHQVIHTHGHFPPALLTGLVSLRARSVFTSHSGELPATSWKRRVIVTLMNRFDRIIALTPHEQRVYAAAGVSAGKIVVIADTINVDFFSQPGNAAKFRARWHIAAAAPVILFVANLRRFKNPDVVLRTFRRVRGQEPRAVLAIVGKDFLPRQGAPPITKLMQDGGVTDGVVLTDWLNAADLRDAYAATAVAINSSATNQESFSISTWEAIAAGCPVCVPRLGTFLSTIGDTTLYHEPADDAALAANILRYLREPELAQAHVRANRTLAEQYTVPAGLAKLRTLYASLLER